MANDEGPGLLQEAVLLGLTMDLAVLSLTAYRGQMWHCGDAGGGGGGVGRRVFSSTKC